MRNATSDAKSDGGGGYQSGGRGQSMSWRRGGDGGKFEGASELVAPIACGQITSREDVCRHEAGEDG